MSFYRSALSLCALCAILISITPLFITLVLVRPAQAQQIAPENLITEPRKKTESPKKAEPQKTEPKKTEPKNTTEPKKKPPVEIEADQQLEWLRATFMYRATGNVVITNGDTVIKSDYAEAHYDEALGPSALTTLHVKGNVVMTNGDRVMRGDVADYDTRTEILVVTGEHVTLNTPGMNAQSNQRMEYHTAEHKAVAKGKAVVTQPNQKITADSITAFLDEQSNELQRAQAVGNVLITKQNPDKANSKDAIDIAQSRQADYDKRSNSIELRGDVKLTRGDNHMQGDHAVIDLTTGYSTLKNTAGAGKGRVRAVFNTGN